MVEIALDALEQSIATGPAANRFPKYMRVCEAFEDCIQSGLFRPGERVPTETELKERLPFSLGTLQKALSRLADRGLIVRNRRTGTFITDRKSQTTEVYVYRFRDSETGELQLPFTRVLRVCVDTSTGPWCESLGTKHCIRVDRLVWVDRDPPAFNSVFLAHHHGKELLDIPMEELHGSSCHRVLIDRFNLPTLRMEHKIGCRQLSADACEHLMVAQGTMGMVWDVRDYSYDDKTNLHQRFQLPPNHRPLEMEEKLHFG